MMIYYTRKVDESVEHDDLLHTEGSRLNESVEHDDLLHTEGRRVGRT